VTMRTVSFPFKRAPLYRIYYRKTRGWKTGKLGKTGKNRISFPGFPTFLVFLPSSCSIFESSQSPPTNLRAVVRNVTCHRCKNLKVYRRTK
jgi:hypothetical protein